MMYVQNKINELPALCSLGRLQSPPLHFGDAPQSASGEELRPVFGRTLMPSVLDKTFTREL